MSSWFQIRQAVTEQWRTWSLSQRVIILGGAGLCLLAVIGVGVWASQPEFVLLADQLAPTETAEIVSAVEAAGIEYQLNFSGSAVLVPKSALSRARLATKDLISTSPQEESGLEESLWADPAQHQARLLREQEQRLARTIMQMRPVRTATVHISRPTPSPFVRDRTLAKASVVLDLRPGNAFTTADTQSLVALVAHSVEGLEAAQVSIVDTDGRQLSSMGAIDGDIATRLEFQQRLEAALAAKAEAVLAQILGIGNAVVRVTAELDFTASKREEISFDPDGKVKKSEDIQTETETNPPPDASGPPGTAANLGSVAGKANAPNVIKKIENNNTQYENAKTTNTTTEVPGQITRLTIAAVIHPPVAAEDETLPPLDPTELEKIIKQAVGFDDARQDQIAVMIAPPGTAPALAVLPVEDPWANYERLIRAASLGIGGLAALALGWMVLRRLRPVTLAAPESDGLSIETAHRLAALSQIVRQQPDVAARVLSAWMNDQPQKTEAPRTEARRAA